eukprot:XP_013983647.1 PREDICTED: unconventional myosin-XVIIIa-like [Salmo salar]
MAVRCFQSNIRTLRRVAKWSWWKLLCRVRPLLDVNMDDQRLRAKEDEIMALRRRLEKSERERNELRQTTDILETKVTVVSSELSDERFRGEAVSQALDTERDYNSPGRTRKYRLIWTSVRSPVGRWRNSWRGRNRKSRAESPGQGQAGKLL